MIVLIQLFFFLERNFVCLLVNVFFIGYFLYIYKELYVTGSCDRSKENEIIVYINLVKKEKSYTNCGR